MLLSKKIKLILISSIILIILPIVYSQQTCTASEIKDALRKALFEYFESPSTSKLSVNEIKDFLHFYISSDANQLTVDCSGSGPLSGKPYYLMLGAARNIERGIPKCGDGTEYGKCSSNVPNYCYGGRLEERCKLCGCPSGKVCSSTGTCAGEAVKSVESQICEIKQITMDKADQLWPNVHNNKIVWTDSRNGNSDVYIHDLLTGSETQITTNSAEQKFPEIYDNKIVWQDWRNFNINNRVDVYMYDLSTRQETKITNDTIYALEPKIYGNKIVYSDTRNNNADIYMYDLTTGKETRITTNPEAQNDPVIYGDKIVWEDSRNYNNKESRTPIFYGNTDIYMYDLSTGKETQITADKSDQLDPSFYNDKIVWSDYRNSNWDIYMYDLSTGKETQITTDRALQSTPEIYDNKIVWADAKDNYDIYMYDISTGQQIPITTDKTSQAYPGIFGNVIVWEDNRNGNWDIYMATDKCIPSQTPIEPIPPAQTLPNPPQIASINPSTGMPNTKVTLTGSGFTSTGNSINWGNQLDAIRELSSPDGKTLTFYALQMQCPRNSCLVSVTNANGTSNYVAFNLTHRPAKKTHRGPPNVKVLTPNGGERYVYGRDKISITWSGGRDSVVLYLMGRMSAPVNEQNDFDYGIDSYIIAKGLPPSGSFEWDGKVCSWFDMNDCRQTYPGFLKILAMSEDKPGEQLTSDTVSDPEHDNWDVSDNPFLLVTPATISSLEITSPNGEEKWIQEKNEYPWGLSEVGTWAPFEWKTFSFAPNNYFVPYYRTLSAQVYSINLLKGGKLYRTMSSGFMYQSEYWNLSSYHFSFPYYVQNANDYSVEVVFHGPNGDVKDISDNVFSIGKVPGVVAVRGMPVDKFTGWYYLPDGYYPGNTKIYPGTRKDGSKFHPIPAYWGAFVFGMATDDVSLSTQKALYSLDYHISNLPIAISKKPDNTFEAVIDVLDQNPQPQRFNAVDSDANLLEVPIWTSAYISLATDVPVTYSVEYAQDGLSVDGSIATIKPTNQWNYNWYWENYGLSYNNLGWLIPLNYDTRVKLVDGSGKAYYSPNINLGLEYTNRGASIIFKNGTVKWSIPKNVQVVYPNKIEYWRTGTTKTIQWKYVNAPANYNPQVSIYLAGSGSGYVEYTFSPWKLIATTQGTSYNWTIPSDVYGFYRILVMGEPYSSYYIRDYSDSRLWISS